MDDRDTGPLTTNERAQLAFGAGVLLTIVIHALPFGVGRWIGWPLVLLSTLAHEMGHGVAALLAGGTFESFTMHADASGLARAGAGRGLGQAIVSAGGLVGPAVVAALLFLLGRHATLARASLIALGAALAASEPLLVQGAFALAFVGVVALALLVLGMRAPTGACQFATVFLGVQLALSVFSRSDYLFKDVARTGSGDFPSDVANMASALGGPYWFWGIVCGAFSILVLALGTWLFLRGFPARRAPQAHAPAPL